MRSPVLVPLTRLLKPLLLIFSVYVLFRGHDHPGGGFVGGLVAASAFALSTMAFGVEQARRMARVRPPALIAAGLLIAAASGSVGLVQGKAFLTAVKFGAVSTVLLFDIGVYLLVTGMTLLVIFTLAEDAQ